jgi:hypothetical protein
MTRILNDVERLVETHLPQWLATPGMGSEKIAAFYADPLKIAVDKTSLRASMMGRRSALDRSVLGHVRRTVGKLRSHIKNAYDEARWRFSAPAPPIAHVRGGFPPASRSIPLESPQP